MIDVFFSYSRSDLIYARLAAALLSAGGNTVFLDVSDLQYGQDWRHQVTGAIRDAQRVLLVWSRRAAKSRWVLMELQLALRLKKIVVPILLDATPVPHKLRHIHAVTELGQILLRLVPDEGSPTETAIQVATRSERSQKFIARNRAPRVHLEYEATPTFKLKLSARDASVFQSAVLRSRSAA